MALGIALAAVLFCLAGVGLVVRYDSINEFLLPSVPYTLLLTLPILGIFGFGSAAWYLAHPIQGPLSLMRIDATHTAGGLAYAIGYPILWIVPAYLWSRRALGRGLTATTALQLLVTSIVAAPLAPIYALFLGTFAENKVQGFALAKVVGIVIVPCVAAYFLTGPWQNAFGLVPHYWSMNVFWLFDAGEVAAATVHAVIGLAWQGVLLVLLARRFSRIMRR